MYLYIWRYVNLIIASVIWVCIYTSLGYIYGLLSLSVHHDRGTELMCFVFDNKSVNNLPSALHIRASPSWPHHPHSFLRFLPLFTHSPPLSPFLPSLPFPPPRLHHHHFNPPPSSSPATSPSLHPLPHPHPFILPPCSVTQWPQISVLGAGIEDTKRQSMVGARERKIRVDAYHFPFSFSYFILYYYYYYFISTALLGIG